MYFQFVGNHSGNSGSWLFYYNEFNALCRNRWDFLHYGNGWGSLDIQFWRSEYNLGFEWRDYGNYFAECDGNTDHVLGFCCRRLFGSFEHVGIAHCWSMSVSYTHLDVYKRQTYDYSNECQLYQYECNLYFRSTCSVGFWCGNELRHSWNSRCGQSDDYTIFNYQ